MPHHRITSIAAASAVVLLSGGLTAGCSSSGSSDTPTSTAPSATTLPELYKQAVQAKQTTVTIYGPSEAAFAPVYDQFTKEFPDIKVTTEFLFGGDLRTRVDQESATGQHVGDLIHLDDSVSYLDSLAPMSITAADKLPKGVSLLDGKLVVPSRSLYTMVYNTDKLSKSDVPTSWAGVAEDPALRGVIGMSNPTSLTATSSVLYTAYTNKAINDAWLKSVAGLDLKTYQSTSQMVGAVATGEISFTPVAYYGFVVTQKAKGASIDFVVPSDGAVLTDNPYGMLNGGPSPLAAQLLASWLLSSDGQTAIALTANEYGTMPGAPAPSGLPELRDVKVFPSTPVDKRTQFKQDAVDQMKKFF